MIFGMYGDEQQDQAVAPIAPTSGWQRAAGFAGRLLAPKLLSGYGATDPTASRKSRIGQALTAAYLGPGVSKAIWGKKKDAGLSQSTGIDDF